MIFAVETHSSVYTVCEVLMPSQTAPTKAGMILLRVETEADGLSESDTQTHWEKGKQAYGLAEE